MKREIFILIVFLLTVLAGKTPMNVNAQTTLFNEQESYCSISIQAEEGVIVHPVIGEYSIEEEEEAHSSILIDNEEKEADLLFDYQMKELGLYNSCDGFFVETEPFALVSVYMPTGILCMRRLVKGHENIRLPQGVYLVEIDDIVYRIMVK